MSQIVSLKRKYSAEYIKIYIFIYGMSTAGIQRRRNIYMFASEFDSEVVKSMSFCTCSWIFFLLFLYEQCLISHLPFKVFHIFTGIILLTLKDFIFFLKKFRNVRAGRAWNDDGHLIILLNLQTA